METGEDGRDPGGGGRQRADHGWGQWGAVGAVGVITGGPDTYGRVSIGTNGRGLLYGDPS